MPKFNREAKVPGKTARELYDLISKDIDHYLEKNPLPGVKLEHFPNENSLNLHAPLATAKLLCQDGFVKLEGNLSLMAMPFKSKIDGFLDRWLKKTFNI